MAVLHQMVVYLIFVLMGLYAKRIGIFTPQNQSQMSALVIRIAYPAIILSGAMADGERMSGAMLRETLLTLGALLMLLAILSWAVPKVLGYSRRLHGAVNGMVFFSSIGLIGVPMIQAVYGTHALIYITMFMIPFNVLFFSYGLKLIYSPENATAFRWKSLVNEGMIACALAVVIYFGNIPIPSTVQTLGSMTAPLAMMLMGLFLADIRWGTMLINARLWTFILMKMVVVPMVITWLLAHTLTQNRELLAVCLAAIAAPTGNVICILASLHNKPAYQTTVDGTALTTIVAVFTMPLVFSLLGLN